MCSRAAVAADALCVQRTLIANLRGSDRKVGCDEYVVAHPQNDVTVIPGGQLPGCGPRGLWEGVASAAECRRLLHAVRISGLADEPGPEHIFPIDAAVAEDLLGSSTIGLLAALTERLTERVRLLHGTPNAQPTGRLLNWFTCTSGWSAPAEVDIRTGSFAPHVDKANLARYDLSAVLYLTTCGKDHSGGEACAAGFKPMQTNKPYCVPASHHTCDRPFRRGDHFPKNHRRATVIAPWQFAFIDNDYDRVFSPRRGALLSFCSGFCNVHQVRPVLNGDRLVLSVWYQAD